MTNPTMNLLLFAMLPFGLHTQDEANDVTLCTVPSAPRGPPSSV